MSASLESAAESLLQPLVRLKRVHFSQAATNGNDNLTTDSAPMMSSSGRSRVLRRIFREKEGTSSQAVDLKPGAPYREKPGSISEASLVLLVERQRRLEKRQRQRDLEEILFEINRQAVAAESLAKQRPIPLSDDSVAISRRQLGNNLTMQRREAANRALDRWNEMAEWETVAPQPLFTTTTSAATSFTASGGYRTADAEALDGIEWRAYGSASSGVERPVTTTDGFDEAPFPITEWHSQHRTLTRSHVDEGADPSNQHRSYLEHCWNPSVLLDKPMSSIYTRKDGSKVASLPVPGEEQQSIPAPHVQEVLNAIKSHGVAAAAPRSATTQTVCALFTYGEPQQRSERLNIVAPVLSRVVDPPPRKSYRAVLEDKVASGEIDLEDPEVRAVIEKVLCPNDGGKKVPPVARTKRVTTHRRTQRLSPLASPPHIEERSSSAPLVKSGNASKAPRSKLKDIARSASAQLVVEEDTVDRATSQKGPNDYYVHKLNEDLQPSSPTVASSSQSSTTSLMRPSSSVASPPRAEQLGVDSSSPASPDFGKCDVHPHSSLSEHVPSRIDAASPGSTEGSHEFVNSDSHAETPSEQNGVPHEENQTNVDPKPEPHSVLESGGNNMESQLRTDISTQQTAPAEPSSPPDELARNPVDSQARGTLVVSSAQQSPTKSSMTESETEGREAQLDDLSTAKPAGSKVPTKIMTDVMVKPKPASKKKSSQIETKAARPGVASKRDGVGSSKAAVEVLKTVQPSPAAERPTTKLVAVSDNDIKTNNHVNMKTESELKPQVMPITSEAPQACDESEEAEAPGRRSETESLAEAISAAHQIESISAQPNPPLESVTDSAAGDPETVGEPPASHPTAERADRDAVDGEMSRRDAPPPDQLPDNGAEDEYAEDDFESPPRVEPTIEQRQIQAVPAEKWFVAGVLDEQESNVAAEPSRLVEVAALEEEEEPRYDDDGFDSPDDKQASEFKDIYGKPSDAGDEDRYSSDSDPEPQAETALPNETQHELTSVPSAVDPEVDSGFESEGDTYANALSAALRKAMKGRTSPRSAAPAVVLPPPELLDVISGNTSRSVSAEPQARPDSKHRRYSRASSTDSRPQYTARDFFGLPSEPALSAAPAAEVSKSTEASCKVDDEPAQYFNAVRPTSRASTDNKGRTPVVTPTSDPTDQWSRGTPPPTYDDGEVEELQRAGGSVGKHRRSRQDRKKDTQPPVTVLGGFEEIDVGMPTKEKKKSRKDSKEKGRGNRMPQSLPREDTPPSKVNSRSGRRSNNGMALDL